MEKEGAGVESTNLLLWNMKMNEWGTNLDYLGAIKGDTFTFKERGKIENAGMLRETFFLKPHKVMAEISDCIIPTDDSVIPFECNSQGIPMRPVPNAIGVTWVFMKAGTTVSFISAGSQKLYRAEKDLATIEFTRNGPILQGVVKKFP